MEYLIAYLLMCAVLVALYVRWWKRRRAEHIEALKRENREAFADGYSAAMGEYARLHQATTYRVVLATPDRPKADPWMEKARVEISRLLDEASHG